MDKVTRKFNFHYGSIFDNETGVFIFQKIYKKEPTQAKILSDYLKEQKPGTLPTMLFNIESIEECREMSVETFMKYSTIADPKK